MIVPSLLNRSNYSFLQSTLTIEEIVDHATRNNFTHVVISDLGSAHSWPRFYDEAISKNLIPVFGLQISYEKSDLLILAKDKLGFRELFKLSGGASPKDISFSHLILIHLDGDDYFPDEPKYVANVEGEQGVYVRENKFLTEDDFEFYCALRAIDTNTSIEIQRELNEHFRGDYLEAEADGLEEDSSQIQNIYEILKQCTRYDILEEHNTLCFFDNPERQLRNMANDSFEAMQ